MSSTWTIVISAITGGVITLATTYVSSLIASKREKDRWDSETAMKFIDYSLTRPDLAKKVARQFSIAVVVYIDSDGTTIAKYFLPAFCRFSVGRLEDHDISIPDPYLSRDQGLFYYSKGKIYYKDTSPTNKTIVNGTAIEKQRKLKSGDILIMGKTHFKFEEL